MTVETWRGKKNFSFLSFSHWFPTDSNQNISERPSVSFYLELSSNQEDAMIVEQPEVTPLTDDQEENEGERGRTALKLASQEQRVSLDSCLESNHQHYSLSIADCQGAK